MLKADKTGPANVVDTAVRGAVTDLVPPALGLGDGLRWPSNRLWLQAERSTDHELRQRQ